MTEAEIEIPGSLNAVTPEWLTAALSGVLADGSRVDSFQSERIGESGFVANLARYELSYRGEPGPIAPQSVVVKLANDNEFVRRQARRLQLFRTEASFYRTFAATSGVRVPKCYLTAWREDEGTFALVLEDIRGARHTSQAAGCPREYVDLAVSSLASLHATWWNNASLFEHDWLTRRGSSVATAWVTNFARFVPMFVARWGDSFDPALSRALPLLAERIDEALEVLFDRPFTLGHGDYRVENLLFRAISDSTEVVLIDWQFCQQLPAAADLHYFVAGSLPGWGTAEVDELLRRYHSQLAARGVRDYPLAALRQDFARSVIWLAIFGVTGMAPVDPAVDDRNRLIVNQLHRRLLEAFVTYEGEQFIPG